jgi:hypothetical protein
MQQRCDDSLCAVPEPVFIGTSARQKKERTRAEATVAPPTGKASWKIWDRKRCQRRRHRFPEQIFRRWFRTSQSGTNHPLRTYYDGGVERLASQGLGLLYAQTAEGFR